jgi:branched-chain amino acid transport system ATP-binding protein
MSALDVAGLWAGYKGAPAIRDVTFSCDSGEVIAIIGPNGAGKSTTLLAISGALALMRGQVRISGALAKKRSAHATARRGLALVPGDRGLFPELTVAEHLRLAERSPARPTATAKPITRSEVFGYFPQLSELTRRRAALLSGGEQQMLAIAKVLLLNPSILMIDELSTGLAPQLVTSLLPTMSQLAKTHGTSVLLVEQHFELVLAVSTRALVMNHGRVVLQADAAELLAEPARIEAAYFEGQDRPP